jgi:hypothetical protein
VRVYGDFYWLRPELHWLV